jgi:hypothetical protein
MAWYNETITTMGIISESVLSFHLSVGGMHNKLKLEQNMTI